MPIIDSRPLNTKQSAAIGRALRDARKRSGLTQMELAELAGLSDRTVRDIEKGSVSPSIGAVLSALYVVGLRLEVPAK